MFPLISGPEVEFFNPKLRHELEKKDADIMAKTKLKGAAPGEKLTFKRQATLYDHVVPISGDDWLDTPCAPNK